MLDDEPHSLTLLEILLTELQVKIVGKSSNPIQALEQIEVLKPDVVFLDIEMPGMNGMEVAEHIQEKDENACIVYVTAYNQYAVKAFEQHALDYVLKPLEKDRLQKTVQRIEGELSRSKPIQNSSSMGTQNSNSKHTSFKISTFASFEVFLTRDQMLKWRTSKAKELFALLIIYAERGIYRDEIIDLLWGDVDYGKSKVYLHACVSFIRKSFQQFGLNDVLHFHNGKYSLNMEHFHCDYWLLNTSLSSVKIGLDEGSTEHVEQLLSLYQGHYLPIAIIRGQEKNRKASIEK